MDALMIATFEDLLKEMRNAVAIELNAPPEDVTVVASFSSDPLFSFLEISCGIKHTRTHSFLFTDLLMKPDEFCKRFINPAVCRLRAL